MTTPLLSTEISPHIALTIEDLEREISGRPAAGLFAWTLTHSTPLFLEIQPVFRSRKELLEHIVLAINRANENERGIKPEPKSFSSRIESIAIDKINREWRAWVDVHVGPHFVEEDRLDRTLMTILYRFIMKRDGRKCVLCGEASDLTIHHIIRKQRNSLPKTPPFGRSVPTNLITLCRKCHSLFDPAILLPSRSNKWLPSFTSGAF